MPKPDNPLEELVARVLAALSQILPAATLDRISDQLQPAIDRVLAPFQILRRDDFEGYLKQLDELEHEVTRLQTRVVQLEAEASDSSSAVSPLP